MRPVTINERRHPKIHFAFDVEVTVLAVPGDQQRGDDDEQRGDADARREQLVQVGVGMLPRVPLDQISAAVAETGGVAGVAPPTLNPEGDTAVVTVAVACTGAPPGGGSTESGTPRPRLIEVAELIVQS